MQTRLILVLIIAIVLLSTSNSFADIYKYSDKNGVMCFADNLQSVPEQYRASAIIVGSVQDNERNLAIQKQPQAQVEEKPGNAESFADRVKGSIQAYAKGLFNGSAMVSVIVVVSALFAFVILGVLDADHKKAIKIVRVVIVWGVSVYLIVAHGGDVVRMFSAVKGTVDTVRHETEEKGKKTAKSLKEINAVIQQVDNAASPDSGGTVPEKKE